MGKYDERSYHQLRRMYHDLPAEDKSEVGGLICGYGRAMIERSIQLMHPDWPESEKKFAVIERL